MLGSAHGLLVGKSAGEVYGMLGEQWIWEKEASILKEAWSLMNVPCLQQGTCFQWPASVTDRFTGFPFCRAKQKQSFLPFRIFFFFGLFYDDPFSLVNTIFYTIYQWLVSLNTIKPQVCIPEIIQVIIQFNSKWQIFLVRLLYARLAEDFLHHIKFTFFNDI